MDELITALTDTGLRFAHFGWSKAPSGDYGIYAERAANSIWADGTMAEQNIIGTVEYYTRDATRAIRDTIQDALDAADVSWGLETVIFETDSGFIHYVWTFEVPVEGADTNG